MTQANERTATLSELVAEEVRALMGRRRMSGRQLATLLNVSPSWVSYRLTGIQAIDVNDMHRIAGALGVGVHELLPPPEVAATAVIAPNRVTERYRSLADRVAASSASAIGTIRDAVNRPPGRRDPAGPGRTVRIPRPPLTMFG